MDMYSPLPHTVDYVVDTQSCRYNNLRVTWKNVHWDMYYDKFIKVLKISEWTYPRTHQVDTVTTLYSYCTTTKEYYKQSRHIHCQGRNVYKLK